MNTKNIALKSFMAGRGSDIRITALEDSRVAFEQTVINNLNAIAASIAIVGDELIELRNLYNAHVHSYTDVDSTGTIVNKITNTPT